MKTFLVLFAFIAFLLSGAACAPLQVGQPRNLNSSEFIVTYPIEEERYDSYTQKNSNSYYKAFPMDSNGYVDKWLKRLSQGADRESMRRYLERSTRYLNLMESLLEEEGLPLDLAYMSMAESGFWPYARSNKNAVGYWQFIKPTGWSYGLTINSYIDERQDFVLSTQAAIRFLKDLYEQFEDWRLSMAAYNAGPPAIKRAIKNHGSRNYWYLVEKKAFPKQETRDFVPKIIAMRTIALDPLKYGFSNLNYSLPLDYGLVSLESSSSLSYISRYLNVPLEDLKKLNPKFKTDSIPVKGQEIHIRVPAYVRI